MDSEPFAPSEYAAHFAWPTAPDDLARQGRLELPAGWDVTVEVETDPYDETKVLVKVQYKVITTNNVFNLVYPFFLQREST